jgi:hypothetical protein
MFKTFNFKLFCWIALGFVCFTVIGTLSHELGHCAMAKYLGMQQISLHYGSMNYKHPENDAYLNMYKRYKNEIITEQAFPEKATFDALRKKWRHDSMLISAAGPLQTMITGSVGFLVLFLYGKRFIIQDEITFTGWIWIFITLFWLRQNMNFFMATLVWMFTGFKTGGKPRGDELILALNLHLPVYSIALVTALIANFGFIWVVFFYLPKSKIVTFLCGGLVGGILGILIWFGWLGKYILP